MIRKQLNQHNEKTNKAENEIKVDINYLSNIDRDWIQSYKEENCYDIVQFLANLLSSCSEQLQLDIFEQKFLVFAKSGKTKPKVLQMIELRRRQLQGKMYMTSKLAYKSKPSHKKQEKTNDNSFGEKQQISMNGKTASSGLSSKFIQPLSVAAQRQKKIQLRQQKPLHPRPTSQLISVQVPNQACHKKGTQPLNLQKYTQKNQHSKVLYQEVELSEQQQPLLFDSIAQSKQNYKDKKLVNYHKQKMQ